MRVVLALVGLLLLVAGCGGRDTPPAPGSGGDGSDLRGRTFLSTKVTENGQPHVLTGQSRVSLFFTDDGRLVANVGCNTIGGPARLDGGRIDVSDLAMTEMGCEAPLHEQDSWLSTFLSGKPSWKLDGTTLVVSSPNTKVVLQDREVAEPDLALRGPRWTVDTVMQIEVAGSVPPGAEATLVFEQDTVSVMTGCNSGSGGYTVSGNKIRFAGIATTRKACEPELMSLERAMLTVLDGEVTYTIDADRLTLEHKSGWGLGLRGNR